MLGAQRVKPDKARDPRRPAKTLRDARGRLWRADDRSGSGRRVPQTGPGALAGRAAAAPEVEMAILQETAGAGLGGWAPAPPGVQPFGDIRRHLPNLGLDPRVATRVLAPKAALADGAHCWPARPSLTWLSC